MGKRRVVVTGMGVASPLGCDVESFWRRLVRRGVGRGGARRSRVRVLPDAHRRAGPGLRRGRPLRGQGGPPHQPDLPARGGGGHPGGGAGAPPRRRGRPAGDRGAHRERRSEASAPPTTSTGTSTSRGAPDPLIIPTSMNSGPAANVSIRFGLGGPLFNVDGACASGTHSVGQAFQMIRSGTLDVALAGGADSVVHAGCHDGLERAARALEAHRRAGPGLPPLQRRPRRHRARGGGGRPRPRVRGVGAGGAARRSWPRSSDTGPRRTATA